MVDLCWLAMWLAQGAVGCRLPPAPAARGRAPPPRRASRVGDHMRLYLVSTALPAVTGTLVTVRNRAIEIDAQEAVSRFLNVHGKPGGQSQSISECARASAKSVKVLL